ncbi:hypothetical protein Tco_1510896, partial [Tanacetum coccineum]
ESVKEPIPRDLLVVQTYAPPTPFLGHFKGQIWSPYRTRKTVCMIENLGEVHKLKFEEDEGDMDVVHITPPYDDYVAPATRPTLDKQLNEFEKECFDITRVAEKGINYYSKFSQFIHTKPEDKKRVPAARRQISRPTRPVIVW